MVIINHNGTDPYFNLALEEYLLKQRDDDVFMLWRNAPSIIVGRNQNTLAEINYDYVKAREIPVVRRMTGGGAVFHDLGNINYTFIRADSDESFNDFQVFTQPVVTLLNQLGVQAGLVGRNDLLINGRKFSGNAQCAWRGKMMHHGTLMFNMNINDLSQALNVNPLKIQSKGIQSVRSRVTNISEHLPGETTLDEFRAALLGSVMEFYGVGCVYALTDADLEAITALRGQKYATWDWNYGHSPAYTFCKQTLLPAGFFDVRLDVDGDNAICGARIFGDYFGRADVSGAERALSGVKHEPGAVRAVLEGLDLARYFSGVTAEQLLSCFF